MRYSISRADTHLDGLWRPDQEMQPRRGELLQVGGVGEEWKYLVARQGNPGLGTELHRGCSFRRSLTRRGSAPAEYHPAMRLPDAVVFDFDGVLLDSETPEYESHRRVYERFGLTLTVAEWCDCIGVDVDRDPDRWSRRLREHAPGAPDHEAFRAEVHQLFAELVPREPMPGIASLIAELTGAVWPAESPPTRRRDG